MQEELNTKLLVRQRDSENLARDLAREGDGTRAALWLLYIAEAYSNRVLMAERQDALEAFWRKLREGVEAGIRHWCWAWKRDAGEV